MCHAHETPGEVSENGKLVWSYSLERKDREHRYELWVKTSTAFLVQLTAQYAEADGARLSTEQVRFIIRDYLSDRFLGVLIKAPDQGKAYRYFGLQLSYSKAWEFHHPQFISHTLHHLDQLFLEKQSGKSREQTSPVEIVPPVERAVTEAPVTVSVNQRRGESRAAPPQPKRYVPRQAEKLPANFVPRPGPFNAVKAMLLQGADVAASTLVVSAIYGLGGIGKSVLAAALADDGEIQRRFPDGTLWVTLGQNPDLLPMLGEWIRALGDYNYSPLSPEAASAHLRTLLYDRQMLLVVDDVWNPVHLDPFRVGGKGSCVLVTTRGAPIQDMEKYDLDVMTHGQAMTLLTQKLGTPLLQAEKQQAAAFAERVGYLPLALELAMAQIEEGYTWEELLDEFRSEVDRLELLDRIDPTDIPDDQKRREHSLIACFNLSLKSLTPEQQTYFAWLGVLPEDADITQRMTQTLWQLTRHQAGSALRAFRTKGLLKGERPTYRLHDLMHDLAVKLLTCEAKPRDGAILSGLGLKNAEAHETLLSLYQAKTQDGQWHTLTDDGHIYANLTWHMLQAEQPMRVHQLLQETHMRGATAGMGPVRPWVNRRSLPVMWPAPGS